MDAKYIQKISRAGSREICNPPPTDTDEDYIVLVEPDDMPPLASSLLANGWELGGSLPVPAEHEDVMQIALWGFQSWKQEDVNYIITTSPEFYAKFVKATQMAKRLNLLEKTERVALFQWYLYNVKLPIMQQLRFSLRYWRAQ